jgi:iron(III) transport system ATP-binding protein
VIETPAGVVYAATPLNGEVGVPDGEDVLLSIRPEQIRLLPVVDGSPAARRGNRLTGDAVESTFLGEASEHVVRINGQRLRLVRTPPLFNPPGAVAVEFDPEDVVVLPE